MESFSTDWESNDTHLLEETETEHWDEINGRITEARWTPHLGEEDEGAKNQAKRKAGRKKARITCILSKIRTRGNKTLKKEYVRCQAIRGIGKSIRNILAHTMPKKGIHKFSPNSQKVKLVIWSIMEDIVFANEQLLSRLGSTREQMQQYKSFNNKCCYSFYRYEAVRKLHYWYLLLVYGTGSVDPEEMCRKLTVRCCNVGQVHSEECRATWEAVRDYVMFEMIKQLKLTPFDPSQETPVEDAIPEPSKEVILESFEETVQPSFEETVQPSSEETVQPSFEDFDTDDLFATPQDQDELSTTS